MSLEKSRTYLMNAIYQMDINKAKDIEALDAYFSTLEISDSNKEKLKARAASFLENIGKIDDILSSVLKEARLDRLSYIDRALLRLAIFEISIEGTIAYQIIINDIVELAKNYSDDNSYKFINAILGDYVRNFNHE